MAANAATTIENLTLTNGSAPTDGTLATGGAGESGGAVRSLSPLTLSGVEVLDSHVHGLTDANPGTGAVQECSY